MTAGWLEGALFLAALTSAAMAVLGLRYRGARGAMAFSLMCAGGACWGGSVLLMQFVIDPVMLELLLAIRYLAAAGLVASLLVFVLFHSGLIALVPTPLVGLLAVQPFAIFIVLLVDPTGGRLVTVVEGAAGGLVATGPAILVHLTYNYLLLTLGVGLILWESLRVEGVYRTQYALFLFGTSFGWATNALLYVGSVNMDLTPVAFTVTAACFLLAIHRYDFMDLEPVAREVLLDVMDDPMVVLDDQDRVLDANRAFADLSGMAGEPTGKALSRTLADYPDLGEALRNATTVPDEVTAGDRWFEVTVTPLGGGSRGRPDGRLVLLHDITALKERERDLTRSERRYRTIAEHFPNGAIGLYNEDLEYVLVDGGLFEYIEFEADDFEGSHISEMHTRTFVERYGETMAAVFDGEESVIEFSHGPRHYRAQYVPIPDEDGDVHLGSAIVVDITELKEREHDLRHQVQQLEMVTSVISHDLRNPLNVAMGLTAEVIESGDTGHLEGVQRAHRRMQDIMEDVLELVNPGGERTDATELSLATVAQTAWEHVQTDGASLTVEDDVSLTADQSRLSQLFENLYRNAVQHGNETVTIRVGALPDARGFYVEDDGPGIPPEERDLVLEPGHTDHREGTGLGLTIVQSIVEGHNWKLELTAGRDGGARFECYTNPSRSGPEPAAE